MELSEKEKYLLIGVLIGVIPNIIPSLPETKRILDGGDSDQKRMVYVSYGVVIATVLIVVLL